MAKWADGESTRETYADIRVPAVHRGVWGIKVFLDWSW
jgi:hypothetical protein